MKVPTIVQEAGIFSAIGVGCAVLFAIGYGIGAFVIWICWNALTSPFHLPHLAFWQCYGVSVLLWLVGGAFKSSTTVEAKK